MLDQQCIRFSDASSDITTDAIASFFELGTWATHAHRFLRAIRDEIGAAPYDHDDIGPTLSHQFTLSIAVVSHLERDPLLPAELLPRTGRPKTYGPPTEPSTPTSKPR